MAKKQEKDITQTVFDVKVDGKKKSYRFTRPSFRIRGVKYTARNVLANQNEAVILKLIEIGTPILEEVEQKTASNSESKTE